LFVPTVSQLIHITPNALRLGFANYIQVPRQFTGSLERSTIDDGNERRVEKEAFIPSKCAIPDSMTVTKNYLIRK